MMRVQFRLFVLAELISVNRARWVIRSQGAPLSVCHQGMQGIEIRIHSLSGDGSHSWVRISNSPDKFVRDLTEKARIPSNDNENDSVRTGRPVEQETRIVKKISD